MSDNLESRPPTIDEGLYSRQLYVLGMHAMIRMSSSHVLICGMGGLGVEIAKNIVLGGIGSITLQDSKDTQWKDLSSQFYLKNSDLSKNRATQSFQQISDINPTVSVKVSTVPLSTDFLNSNKFAVIVLTEGNQSVDGKESIEDVLEYCHVNGIFVVLAETRGLFSRVFCDFGKDYSFFDAAGGNIVTTKIAGVSQKKKGIVTCLDQTAHGLQDGDYVEFSDVQGMTELNRIGPIRIKVTSLSSFRILMDTRGFQTYIGGGVFTVQRRKKLDFESYQKSQQTPNILITDEKKEDCADTLNIAFQALDAFFINNGSLPRVWNAEDANKLADIASKLSLNYDMTINLKIIRLLSYIAQGQICPMNSFIGGVAAMELIKACSGKFHPIFQWTFFDAVECLSVDTMDNLDWDGKLKMAIQSEDFNTNETRFDAQVAVFGRKFQNDIGEMNCFVAGVGAIGCELLKNLAMLGVASGSGKLYITDMDVIERSNLPRQFLFNQNDLGESKSKMAAAAVKKFNPNTNITFDEHPVGIETENIYTDQFFTDFNIVLSAVDTIEGRKFLCRKCEASNKTMLESGTSGTLGNTQVIIPFITETYNVQAQPQSTKIAALPTPAIITTPSAISGLMCLELLKITQGKNEDIASFKNGYIDLASPFFGFKTPIPAEIKKQ